MVSRRRWFGLAALLTYGALAVGLFWQAWEAPTSRVVGSDGDPFTYVWFMRWFAFALTHGLNPFVTDYVNYPQLYNLQWNTPMPLAGWLLAPVTLTLGPVLAYNVVMTAALALSAFVAFLVFSRYAPHPAAAFVGGLVYGFSPYMVTQAVGHWHMVMAWTPPLVLLLLDEIVARERRSPLVLGALLGVLSAVQLLLAEEVLATEVMIAAVGVAILAVLYRRRLRRPAQRLATALGAAMLLFVPVVAYPLWVQFLGPEHLTGVIQPRNVYVTDLLNFVVPTSFQWLSPQAAIDLTTRFTGNGSEWDGYLGLPLLLAAAYAAVRHWGLPVVRVVALLALTTAVLSLGAHLHVGGVDTPVRLPYLVVNRLPLFGNLLPNRLALYVSLFVGLLLAILLDALLRRGRLLPAVAAGLLSLAVVAPLVPRLPYQASPTNTPAYFLGDTVNRLRPGEVVLVAPFSNDYRASRPMAWQADASMRFRMPEGYLFTAGPGGAPRLGPRPFALSTRLLATFDGTADPVASPAEVDQYRADLRAHGVEALLVGPMPHEDRVIALFSVITGRDPEPVGGAFLWPDTGLAR